MEAAKKTKGRQKVEMKAIADESKRHVAFSKRKAGLFNKTAELNVLTGTEIAAIVFSRRGKAYKFATPGSGSAVAAWLSRRAGAGDHFPTASFLDGAGESAWLDLRRLEDANGRLTERRRSAEAAAEKMKGCVGFWWELPERSLETAEELEAFEEALVELRKKVEERVTAAAMMRQRTSFSALLMDNGGGRATVDFKGGNGNRNREEINGLVVSSPSSEVYN